MSAKCFFVFRFAFPLFTEYNITKTTGEDIMKTMKHYFTLIEVLTVAAIIAILAGISVGVVGLINSKNAEAQTQATIKALELALGQFKADNGHIYIPSDYTITDFKPIILKLDKNEEDQVSRPKVMHLAFMEWSLLLSSPLIIVPLILLAYVL